MRCLFSLIASLVLVSAAWADPFMSPESVPSAEKFRKEVVAEGFNHPWSMAWLPDGSILVSERPGGVRIIKDGKLQPMPVQGGPAALALGQGGLLEISVHPDFEKNRLVYFTLAAGTRQANRTVLARARFDGARFSNVEEIFKVSQTKSGGQHFGSRLLWLPDKTLLMSIGDGGNPPVRIGGKLARDYAQDFDSHLGKILHLKDDGTPAKQGPFTAGGGFPEVYTVGHRNIQGMAYDPIRSQVWVSEHGALGGDELNLIQTGMNYGWPRATFSKEYLGARDISDHTTLPGMVDPVLVWKKATAPSGLTLYTGDAFPQWQGDLFAGGLRDQAVRRIILADDGTVEGEEIIRVGERVRDVRQGPDGLLYILTDQSDGQLIKLVPSEETDPNP